MHNLRRLDYTDIHDAISEQIHVGGQASVHTVDLGALPPDLLIGDSRSLPGPNKIVYRGFQEQYIPWVNPTFRRVTGEVVRLLGREENVVAADCFRKTVNIPIAVVTKPNREGRETVVGMLLPHVPDRFYFNVFRKKRQMDRGSIVGRVAEMYPASVPVGRQGFLTRAATWGFLESMAFGIAGLHFFKTFHGDLHASNVYFGAPTSADPRTRAYLIDAFNGFSLIGNQEFNLLSPLEDPWAYEKRLTKDPIDRPDRTDVFQLCAWAYMAVIAKDYWHTLVPRPMTTTSLETAVSELKSRVSQAREDIRAFTGEYERITTVDPTLKVMRPDVGEVVRAGLGPPEGRPSAKRVYAAFHQEFVDARRAEK